MARTHLLQRLISACAAAAPADAHATVPPTTLTRRELLGGVVAAGALAACGRVDAPSAPQTPLFGRKPVPAPSVAIVGAGLAGLTCAYRLRQAGITATVYEGSDRLGGRCWTRRKDFAEGQIAEHGGELIDQSHTEIRQLAQELGLSLDNMLRAEASGTEPLFHFDGEPYTYEHATRDMRPVWQTLHRDLSAASYPTLYNSYTPRGWELDHMSLAEWIEASVPGGLASKLGQLLEVAYVIEYGAEIADQSALNLIYLMGYSGQGQLRLFGPSNEKYHVRGGNDQIVSRLATALPGQVETGRALTHVVLGADARYTLRFADGSATTVDRVVLALPFSIIRASVDVSKAGFNAVKLTAIREQGMGANTKVNAQFRSRFWRARGYNGDSFSDTGYQATWEVSRGQPGTAGILVGYTGGDAAVAASGSADSEAAKLLAQLEPALPGSTKQWNGRATVDYWPGNPWVRGAYSYWRVGQYTKFAGAEAEVSGGCHFAGEHTSVDAQGYLNGAVESGERAAAEIVAVLKAAAKA